MNIDLANATSRAMTWAKGVAGHAGHPWHSPEWFGRVQTSFPANYCGAIAGRQARVLITETIAGERFRAKRAFRGVA